MVPKFTALVALINAASAAVLSTTPTLTSTPNLSSSPVVKTPTSTALKSYITATTGDFFSSSRAPCPGPNVGKGLNTGVYSASTTSSFKKAAATSTNAKGQFTDWTTFKANGVNLAGWFEIELSNNPEIFATYAPTAADEWSFCESLGIWCGPVLEEHYATFYTTADIDKLAAVGVNFLRIPMTYAAWVKVPGSELYHGFQSYWLYQITSYAINKYGMRVAIGLHSLPGGVNDLDIGEALGHDAWFYNSTNLAYSYEAVEAIPAFIELSGNQWAYSIEVINEPSDNIAGFATAAGLTTAGSNYIVNYVQGCLNLTAKVDKRIPIVLQDAFLGEKHWSPFFPAGTNLVIDTHIYYFAASGIYSEFMTPAICGQASVAGGDGKFPVYIGEWSLQVLYNNTYSARTSIFNTQRYAWQTYVSGGAFWSSKFSGVAAVDGQGTQEDYWNYEGLISSGVISAPVAGATYC